MAPSNRQERRQMRQRGAGSRKVDTVDFGLSFGLTPARTHRSARKTPLPAPAALRRSSKTPSTANRPSSTVRSVRSTSAAVGRLAKNEKDGHDLSVEQGTTSGHATASSMNATGTATKGLRTPATEFRSTSAALSSDSLLGRKSKPRRRTSGPAFVQIAEDPEVETENGPRPDQLDLTEASKATAPLEQSENQETWKENASPEPENDDEQSFTAEKSKRKAKKRKSIGQQSGRKKKRSSAGSAPLAPTQPGQRVFESSKEREESAPAGENSTSSPVGLMKMPVTAKRRKKRKSVLMPRKRRISRESGSRVAYNADEDADEELLADLPQQEAEESVIAEDSVSTLRRTSINSKDGYRKRKTPEALPFQTPQETHSHEAEADAEGDETYVDAEDSAEEATPKPPVPKAGNKSKAIGSRSSTQQSHGSSHKRSSGRSPLSGAKASRPKKAKASFPILIHRLTNISALPTITEETEDRPDGIDSDVSDCKFPNRSAPNAIDVLAQVCRETIEATVSKLSTANGSTAASAKEVKRKRTAIEAFGQEIDSRLFDMSAAVENRLTLEARFKKSKREKAQLQAQWMEVRKQREEVALKCDEIRRKHWEDEAEGRESHELSERLHELEMHLERDRQQQEEEQEAGLEYMIRTVARDVSSVEGGGILDRVKEFNRQLERTALVFEGRTLD